MGDFLFDFVNAPAANLIFISTIVLSLLVMYRMPHLYDTLKLVPYEVIHYKRWWQLFSSGFIHADMVHLMFNMLTFFFFAFNLEVMIGSVYFIIIYFGSMVLADVSSLIKHKNNMNYASLGASGAVAGIIFSFIMFRPDAKLGMMLIPIPIPAPIFALLYLIYCYMAAKRGGDFIAHDAHLWGSVAGIVITILLVPEVVPYFFNVIFGG